MNNHILPDFAARFKAASLPSLIDSLNALVGKRGFNSVRAIHDCTLIDELIRRGIGVSAVYDGKSISFAHKVTLDVISNKLTLI